MKLSAAGRIFIARQEGLLLRPYNDSAGNCTIGVGHLIHMGNCTPADSQRYAGFTVAAAEQLLARDVEIQESEIRARLSAAALQHASQHAFDAMVDIVYNCGPGPIEETAIEIERGDWRGATQRWLAWDHAGGVELAGLKRRRIEERALALCPDDQQPAHFGAALYPAVETQTPQQHAISAARAWERELTDLWIKLPPRLHTQRIRAAGALLRRLVHSRTR